MTDWLINKKGGWLMIGCNWWTGAAWKQIVEISYVNDVDPSSRSHDQHPFTSRREVLCTEHMSASIASFFCGDYCNHIGWKRISSLVTWKNLVRKQYKHQFSTIKLLLLNSWFLEGGDLSKNFKVWEKIIKLKIHCLVWLKCFRFGFNPGF